MFTVFLLLGKPRRRVCSAWAVMGLLGLTASMLLGQAILPRIEIQPQGRTVGVDDQVTMTAMASVEATGFQWFKDGQFYRGGTGRYAPLAWRAQVTDAGDYYAVFTNAFSSVTSQVARLTVIAPGPPTFVREPQNIRVRDDQFASLSGEAVAAGGSLSYRWLRFGTNFPSFTGATLSLQVGNPQRYGDFQLVATATPGGSSTSRVASVSVRPGMPPTLSADPRSITVPLGARTRLDAVVADGDVPMDLDWYLGTNLVSRSSNFSPPLPTTNDYTINGVSASTAGDYRFVASNRFGAVTSAVAEVHFLSPQIQIVSDLSDASVDIGQYNTANLTNGLVGIDRFTQAEISHTLLLRPDFSQPPFPSAEAWHLSLSPSNVFHAANGSGGTAITGFWGYVPGTAGFTGIQLTNYPVSGAVTRLECFENGTYSAGSAVRINGSDLNGTQSGRLLVFGTTRPSTAVLTATLSHTNSFSLIWYKDGVPLNTGFGSTKYSSIGVRQAPFINGVTNTLYRLAVSNFTVGDLGRYWFSVQNFGGGFPGSVQTSRLAEVRLHGWTATNAPAVNAARELRSTGTDSVQALSVAPDGSLILGSQMVTFGSGSGTTAKVIALDPSGRTNWQTAANGVSAVLPTGDGGAFIAGSEGSSERSWFLRRVATNRVVTATATNLLVTNVWSQRLYGPNPTEIQINPQPYRANVVGMVTVADGLLVAGQFSGGQRFGAVVVTNGAIPSFNVMGGGIVLTNSVANLFSDVADLYVAKYALDGRLLWARRYGNTNAEVLAGFAADSAGNLYLGGSFSGTWTAGTVTARSSTATNGSNVSIAVEGFVMKLDPSGTPLWIQPVGGLPRPSTFVVPSRVRSLSVTPSGKVYFVSTRTQNLPLVLRPGLTTSPRFLGQLNPDGEPVWVRELRTVLPGNDATPSLATAADEGVVIADAVQSFLQQNQVTGIAEADLSGMPGAPVEPGTALAKFTPDGELLWLRTLDTRLTYTDESRPAITQRIGFDGDGGLILGGQLPARLGSAQSLRGSGQRFDSFELVSTNRDSNDAFDLFIARLAPNYEPLTPQISRRPLSGTPTLTDTVTLEGQATGVPTPTYQWTLNGNPLPGATNRFLTIDRLSRTNRGLYRLVASNSLGVVTSDPAAIQPQLTPNMRGWRYVTSVTNHLGDPQNVGLDNAGRLYVQHGGTAQGLRQWLERWNPDGTVAWRFQQFPSTSAQGVILHRKSPVVTPGGEVLIFGRSTAGSVDFNTPNGGFVARLDPETGVPLWQRSFFWTNTNPLLPVTLAVHGNEVRALFSGPLGSFIHRTALDGTALDPVALTGLPAGVRFPEGQDWSSRTALAADGSLGVWAAGTMAWNFGLTNLPVQNPPGYTLARYAADGTPQWLRQFSQTGATTDVTSAEFDAAGNLVLGFDLPGNAPIEYTFGTNRLRGWGGLAKVSPAGAVLWAKAWGLHVRDARLSANGDVTFTGPIRRDYQASPSELRVRFGTNYVAAFARNDVIVARVNASGNEGFIRQTGSENLSTYDNARNYTLAVNGNGLVATAGFNLMPHSGGPLDFGNQTYLVPNLEPFNFANLFGDLAVFYAAVLDPSNGPTEPPVIRFAPPTPGSTDLRLEWPAGYVLQRLPNLGSNDWSTLPVASPYTVGLNEAAAAFFRVVPAP